MKKRLLLVFLVIAAALAAAFAFEGCKKSGETEKETGKREYAVFDDGCGKKYRLKDGEQQTVYYGYDAQKVLDFSVTYYNEATNEETDSDGDLFDLPCNKPVTYTYTASPLNADGINRGACYLTVIVSAQDIIAPLMENGSSVDSNIAENIGAVYTFVPEMTGVYTVSCVCDDGRDRAEFTVTDNTGEVMDGSGHGLFNKGWKYYVHVSVKVGTGYSYAGVETKVAFTPPVLKEGENQAVLGDTGNTFAFTPEESGAYSADDDADGGYRWLDGETYQQITPSQWENEVILEAGKKYFVDGQVGYASERQAKLTVKRVDREFIKDTENELKWNEMYVFTADKTSNYKFTAELEKNFYEARFTVYDWYGYEKYGRYFKADGEFELLLGKGRYVIRVSENCTAKVMCSPRKLGVDSGSVYAENGETLSFTAPVCCVYAFSSFGHDSAEFAVTDKDGNVMNGKRLVAGVEYRVTVNLVEEDVKNFRVNVAPVADGEIVLNRTISDIGDGRLYSFTPALSGRYKFVGASVLEVYDGKTCEALATDGDKAYLQGTGKYYVYLEADTLTYGKKVTAQFYPQAIPTDGVSSVSSRGYMRFDLPFDDEVTLSLRNYGALAYEITDAGFNEIKAGEIAAGNTAPSLITLNLTAGCYFLYCNNSAEIKFVEAPLGCGGVYNIETDDRYVGGNTEHGYRFACGLGVKEFTVTIHYCDAIINYCSLNEIIKVYYSDGGTERSLAVKNLTYDNRLHKVTVTYEAKSEEGEYFIKFMPDYCNYEFSVGGVTPA